MAWLDDVEDCAQIEVEGSLGNVDSWVLLSHEVDVAHGQILQQVNYWSFLFFGRHGNRTKEVPLFIALTVIQAPSPLWSSSSSSRSTPSPSTSSSPRTRCASCRCTWCRAWWLLMTIQYLIPNIYSSVKNIISNWYRASSSRRWRSCRVAPCKPARRTCIAGGFENWSHF